VWQATDAVVSCNASDNANGSGLAGPSSFSVSTNVPVGTETNSVTIPAVTVNDVAGNTSLPQPPTGAFGPFDVDKKAPVISAITISPSSPTFGQTVTATYTCSDGGSGVVLCGPSGSQQIAATASTTVTSPADSTTGDHTFTVTSQDAVGNITMPASSVSYTVSKATPVITWANPAAIVYGTPLSATQLNATANVTGAFVYTPAPGTILSVGIQTLSVAFTPGDTADYSGSSKQVSLTVSQATTTTTITSISPNPAPPNSPVTVSWSVIGSTNATAPTGTVTVKASTGEICSAAVSTGGCALTFTTTGARTVTASYSGDTNFQASSTTSAVQVTVGDFSITATPASQTISSGHSAVYTITVAPIGGLTGTVNLSCSGGPPNTTCSVSPSSDNLQGGSVKSTVTLMANKNVTHGTYVLTFTGSYGNGALVHSFSVSLTVKGQN
jgi:hypothetical protein